MIRNIIKKIQDARRNKAKELESTIDILEILADYPEGISRKKLQDIWIIRQYEKERGEIK